MNVRRVVTGHDADGKAMFVRDEDVPPVTLSLLPGSEFHQLWGGDAAPKFPDDGTMPDYRSYFPPVGGFRFGLFTVPPRLAEHLEPDDPGMHTTATIDFEVVLSGQVSLELDDGARVTLNRGDTVVQNGTRHRWSNPGSEPAVLAVFIAGAHHDQVG